MTQQLFAWLDDRLDLECHNNHDIVQPSDAMLGPTRTRSARGATPKGTTATRPPPRCGGIDTLKAAIAHSQEQIERVENSGIDMADPALMLREASNHLTLARTEMHAFDPKLVDAVLAEGMGLTTKVDESAQAAQREVSYRRTGLAVSLAFIVLVVIALQMKIRTLEKSKPFQGGAGLRNGE